MGAVVSGGGAFDGAREDIARAFGFEGLPKGRTSESLRQLCKRMSGAALPDANYVDLVTSLYQRIALNCSPVSTSVENWRWWKPQTKLDDCNGDKEVLLERTVAILAKGRRFSDWSDWSNQVPVISGHAAKQQKKCAVDLVRLSGTQLDLIELKLASDTPIYAAFEILLYGLAYVFCRLSLRYSDQQTMNANVISLRVLAPRSFYKAYSLEGLESGLSHGFNALLHKKLSADLRGDFRLQHFPPDFLVPFETGADVKKACTTENPAPAALAVLDALHRIQPVYP